MNAKTRIDVYRIAKLDLNKKKKKIDLKNGKNTKRHYSTLNK